MSSCNKTALSQIQGKKDLAFPLGMYSAIPESSNNGTPLSYLLTDNAVGFSEAGSSDSAFESSKDTGLSVETKFKAPHFGISNVPKNVEKPDDSHNLDTQKKKSQISPDSYGQLRYCQWQQSDVSDIRHQLLVQRTFNNLDDHPEPRTSSPLRKIRICTVASGIQTATVSPSSGTLPCSSKNSEGRDKNMYQPHPSLLSPFLQSPNDNAVSAQEIFKTPNRNKHSIQAGTDVTASHPLTVSMLSPASTPSLGFTPGRQFVNPFEIDHDRMHMPIYSPNMFTVTGSVSKAKKKEKESFWSVEHAALIMPVDIKEAEIRLQHRHQQKFDREQDAKLQSAINKFFSNEHIVPSPWSERVKHILPRTPGAVRSVSSQTVMSVPPHVDLFATIEEKYLVTDMKNEQSPTSDFFGSSFIRRKLLNQLNDNDSELFGSSPIPVRSTDENSVSPFKQTTPEWEKETPNKLGSSHFSSSPIGHMPGEKGHHHALCENDMLASPELSPIAGRTMKSQRSSGIFYSHQDEDSPRAVMQLDFSSILDDPEDVGIDTKTGILMHKGGSSQLMDSITKTDTLSASDDRQFLASNTSEESDRNSNNSRQGVDQCNRSVVTSAMSTESTSETAVTMAQSQSSHDTGYQTASLQATSHESASNSNLSQEGAPPTSSSQDIHSFPVGFISDFFTGLRQPKDHVFKIVSPEDKTKHKSNSSLDANGSFLGYAFESSKKKSSSADNVACFRKKDETCRVRKVFTISDMRHLKEKSSVSRDLIQSFNEELEKSGSNTATRSSWLELSSDGFVPVASPVTNKGIQDQKVLSESIPFCRDFPASVRKRHDENDNAHNVSNDLDVSMQSTSSVFNSSLEKKILTTSNDMNIPEKVNPSDGHISCGKYAKFSFDDDSSLKEARLLLDRSEELRNRVFQPKALDSDYLYQTIFKCVENENPQSPLKKTISMPQTSSFRIDAVDSSTPTSRMLDNVRKKVDQVEGSKLGSEIAAEILKRAGDDLARLTSLLGYGKK